MRNFQFKKANYIIAIFLLTACANTEQKVDNQYTNGEVKNGLEHGLWVYHFEDSNKLFKKGRFDEGLKVEE